MDEPPVSHGTRPSASRRLGVAVAVFVALVLALAAVQGGLAPPKASTSSRSTPDPLKTASTCTRPQWTTSEPKGQWRAEGHLVNNNEWSGEAGPQTMYACGAKSWYVISNQPELANNPGSVKVYPNTERQFYLSGEPAVSSFSTITSSFEVRGPEVGQYDFAYDLWLNKWAVEVMVWNDYRGLRVPPGGSDATKVSLDGTAYHAWHNGTRYIALARTARASSGTVDLRHVLAWLVGQGWLAPTSTLTDVEYGVEISSTGGAPAKFSVNNYSLKVT